MDWNLYNRNEMQQKFWVHVDFANMYEETLTISARYTHWSSAFVHKRKFALERKIAMP